MPDEKTPAEIELEDSIRSIRGVGENAGGTDAGGTDAGATDDGATDAAADSAPDESPSR
jgi:hypothetical protein